MEDDLFMTMTTAHGPGFASMIDFLSCIEYLYCAFLRHLYLLFYMCIRTLELSVVLRLFTSNLLFLTFTLYRTISILSLL